MKTYTKVELDKILDLHAKWLKNEEEGERADLSNANLACANLSHANLACANLSNANLSNANLGHFSIVPESGPFTAYKKLKQGIIAELYVPRSSKRIGGLLGRKCRVSKVKVKSLSIGTEAYDRHSGELLYKVGCWVTPDLFDDDIRKECTNGIHCFITRKEAEEY